MTAATTQAPRTLHLSKSSAALYERCPLAYSYEKVERRAAYESLASYPADAREPYVQRGVASRDAAIRAICGKVTHG